MAMNMVRLYISWIRFLFKQSVYQFQLIDWLWSSIIWTSTVRKWAMQFQIWNWYYKIIITAHLVFTEFQVNDKSISSVKI